MSDEIKTTVIQNPRKVEAPRPPVGGYDYQMANPYMQKQEGVSDPSVKQETEIEALKRRVAALEHALNGKVSE